MTETTATPDFLWLFVKMMVGVVAVIGVALIILRYLSPRGRFGKKRQGWGAVVSRVMLEPRKGLYLLKVAGRYLVVGTTDHSLSLLTELSKEEGEKIENN